MNALTEKKEYVKAASEVVLFNNKDAITTSGCTSDLNIAIDDSNAREEASQCDHFMGNY